MFNFPAFFKLLLLYHFISFEDRRIMDDWMDNSSSDAIIR